VIEVTAERKSLMHHAIGRLADAGTVDAGREAWWIWEMVSNQSPLERVTRGGESVEEPVARRFLACIERRCGGEPLAYVLGTAAFRSLVLRSDGRALIPRPETEGLVDIVLKHQRTGMVADIGTGTGCIALSLAREGDYQLVMAVEKSPAAAGLARLNIQEMDSPVVLVRGDLATSLRARSLDVMVSNPPYLTDQEYAQLSASVRSWEPRLALHSGPGGLEATRQLIQDGLRVVKPGGWLILEVDCSRAAQVAAEAAGEGWSDVHVEDDLFGRARYLVARRS
jgi:release factor glutamine methyltransferase